MVWCDRRRLDARFFMLACRLLPPLPFDIARQVAHYTHWHPLPITTDIYTASKRSDFGEKHGPDMLVPFSDMRFAGNVGVSSRP